MIPYRSCSSIDRHFATLRNEQSNHERAKDRPADSSYYSPLARAIDWPEANRSSLLLQVQVGRGPIVVSRLVMDRCQLFSVISTLGSMLSKLFVSYCTTLLGSIDYQHQRLMT